jgi:hypothetical protein
MCRPDDIVITLSQRVICAVLSKVTPILANGLKAAQAGQQTNPIHGFGTLTRRMHSPPWRKRVE